MESTINLGLRKSNYEVREMKSRKLLILIAGKNQGEEKKKTNAFLVSSIFSWTNRELIKKSYQKNILNLTDSVSKSFHGNSYCSINLILRGLASI